MSKVKMKIILGYCIKFLQKNSCNPHLISDKGHSEEHELLVGFSYGKSLRPCTYNGPG